MKLPPLYRRARLLADGYAPAELRRLLRAGALTPVRRGAYLNGGRPPDAAVRHALTAQAAIEHLGDGAVFSHVTAAVLHGLPVWSVPLDRVHATRPRSCGGRRSRAVLLHSAALAPSDIDVVNGLPVTSLARTVVDLARTVSHEAAVAIADAALRGDPDADPPRYPLEPATLAAAAVGATRWPGAPAARRVIDFADGRSGSVGESRSRVALRRAGLPDPVLQWEVRDGDGRLIGYVDFGWPAHGVVGEFDGRTKYGRLLRPGADPGDVVYAEKLREDRLRAEGLTVIRWNWSTLSDFAPTAQRLRTHLAAPEPPPPAPPRRSP